MLEFIVLGQIPGTHIQINFTTVLACIPALLVMGEFVLFLKRKHKPEAATQIAETTN